MSAGASSKRRAASGDDDLDAALDALATRLGGATTHDQDSLVALICEVLGVDPDTAGFYLEASNNDPHAAVQLHVQSAAASRPQPHGPRHHHGPQKRARAVAASYGRMPVTIAEMPAGWSARLSDAGTVVFVHDASGHEQAAVPPGWGNGGAPSASADDKSAGDDGMADVPASHGMADMPASPPAAEPPAEPSREHPHVICDACERHVSGTRYQCLTRVNFDLCGGCMWSEASAPLREGHQWMKMSFVQS